MSRRMLLPILILLCLCWCVLATLGVVAEPSFSGGLDLNARSLQQLRSRLTARLPASQVRLVSGAQSGCSMDANTLTVPESVSCVFAIQPDAGKTRQLNLSLGSEEVSVKLLLTQPNALSVEAALETGQTSELDIYRNDANQGAELTLEGCVAVKAEQNENPAPSNACTLEIKE
jgi:hypothetical protein